MELASTGVATAIRATQQSLEQAGLLSASQEGRGKHERREERTEMAGREESAEEGIGGTSAGAHGQQGEGHDQEEGHDHGLGQSAAAHGGNDAVQAHQQVEHDEGLLSHHEGKPDTGQTQHRNKLHE